MYHIANQRIYGWKYNFRNLESKPQAHLLPSLVMTVVIVLIVAQVLALIDKRLELRASDGISLNTLFSIPVANAAELDYSKEATKMIQSSYDLALAPQEYATFTVGFKNNTKKTWRDIGPEQMLIVQKKQSGDYKVNSVIYGSLREEAKPGQVAYFIVHLIAPQKIGSDTLEMVLVRSGKKITGSEFTLNYQIREAPKSSPQPVVVSAPAPKASTSCSGYKVASSLDQDDCLTQAQPNANTPTSLTNDGPLIRIGLFSNVEAQTIRPSKDARLVDSAGQTLLNISAGSVVAVDYLEGQGVYGYGLGQITNNTPSYLKIISDSTDNVFEVTSYENRPAWKPSINDNTFLGSFELRYNTSKNRTWLINILPLETYLKGTAEVANDAPAEYLRAMAIAERTYATHHLIQATKHADEFFIIDSALDQVYKGYGTQQRMNNLLSAVEATRGQVVTYNGEIAITPYYSWSDGRTRSMLEVWKVDKPWLQSVKEPAGYDKTTMYGHGVGLSGRGAFILARDFNYSADQILKYYYTGVSVAGNYNNKF